MKYEGQFVDGYMQAEEATLIKPDYVYKGGFFKDLKHGQGSEEWTSDNRAYTGQYHMGLKQGKGKMTWDSGCYYTGQFY